MESLLPTPHEAARRAGVRVALADVRDLPEVLRVQHAGFARVARQFGIPPESMPPVTETTEDLARLRSEGVRTHVAFDSDRVVGTVRARVRGDGVVEIGRLAVDDGYERRGIAMALLLALESDHPGATRFELFTGGEATGPLALYDRLGYRVFSREQYEHYSMVWLAKDRRAPYA